MFHYETRCGANVQCSVEALVTTGSGILLMILSNAFGIILHTKDTGTHMAEVCPCTYMVTKK